MKRKTILKQNTDFHQLRRSIFIVVIILIFGMGTKYYKDDDLN